MTDLIKKISSPQLEFEGVVNLEKFVKTFADLYRIELFKDGLDLILTKLEEKQLKFEVRIIKGWDTNLGCFLTEKKSFYDQTLGKVIQRRTPKIILRNLSHNLMAHEMAHALEFESGLNLGEDFRKCIGFDMKNRDPEILTLKGEVKRLMVDALKSYKPEQFISELFARYFELLSISRNVCATGSFATSDVMGFFENTTNFIEQVFNPQIRAQINPRIAAATSELSKQIKLEAPQQKFQERVESVQRKSAGSWTKGTKSNAMWQAGWNKAQELEDKK
ncbi:MAG: hypothetical protein KA100_03290 [Rickettsiales bacterium]|nr:hypothetical protein [Rickettsiales bacterium]